MLQIKLNDSTEFTFEEKNNELFLNGDKKQVDFVPISKNKFHVLKDNLSYTVEIIDQTEKSLKLLINGKEYETTIKSELDQLLDKMGISAVSAAKANDLKAPMPGLVLDIKVAVGQEIKVGDPVVVLEAMKMENILKSPADAVIKAICVTKGKNVEKNAILVEFE